MRGAAMAATVLVLGMAAGCGSVPEWVQKGSGAFDGQEGNAFYGVGIAAPSPNQAVQHDMAKLSGRLEIARTRDVYVAELLKLFVREHHDFFDDEFASSVNIYDQAARQVSEAHIIGSEMIDSWRDRHGLHGRRGTLYVLMVVRADDKFFDIAKRQYAAVMREHQARLLKKEADAAFRELDKELEKARRDPFGIFGTVRPEPEAGEDRE